MPASIQSMRAAAIGRAATLAIALVIGFSPARSAAQGLGDSPGAGDTTVVPTGTATRFENTELVIAYTPGMTAPGQPADWWHGSRSRAWSGKTASFNRSAGARASITFTGTSVRWIGFRAPWAGIAIVYLDGVQLAELDLYTPQEQPQTTIYSTITLPVSAHTFVVEATGRKNALSSDYAVVVDAFDVTPPSPPPTNGTRVDERNGAVIFSGGWSQGDTSTAWSGGTAAASTSPGARASISFIGTSATWVGLRSPKTGIAIVYLDGRFEAEVDTYSATEVQSPVFEVGNLAPGRHTLTIEVTGQHGRDATDSVIYLDAFDVRSRFEETDAGLSYAGSWAQLETRAPYSGTSGLTGTGTAALSSAAGARATFGFAGTAVSWIGSRGPAGGIANVYLDGTFVMTVDTFATSDQHRTPLFSAANLADITHTVAVEVTGAQNVASGGTSIVVDAFDVGLSPSVPTVARWQETDSAATFTAGWTLGPRFQFWSGEHAMYSSTLGAQATFTFTGQSVRWLGDRGFGGGIARIYLDGVFVADVDTHAALQEEYQSPLFIATNLTNDVHTLTIEVTGLKSPNSSGTQIVVDAFEVY